MINLIPNQEKKKMVIDFYYRLVVLFLWTLCVCILVAIIALMPAYFFSNSKYNIASKKLEVQKSESAPIFDEGTAVIVKDINDKLNLIENLQKSKFIVSEKVINTIFSKKTSGIKITQISYDSSLSGGLPAKKINVTGTASSREVLLAFRQALEKDSSFKNVNLPVSNFVKGSNIQFYLSVTPM